MKNEIIIFSDGSSKGNPGPGGWGAIIKMPNGKLKEIGGSEKLTTNNRMEMMAALEALKIISNFNEEITINTDSSYLINGITKWVKNWQKNGWMTKDKKEVLNKDLWQKISELSLNKKINWNYVGGHIGIKGNERCDVIANSFADLKPIDLFDGEHNNYHFDLSDMSATAEKVSKKSGKNKIAYSYISKLGGLIKIHKTWTECEERVKGKAGAKYKKSFDKDHEKEIIKEFSN